LTLVQDVPDPDDPATWTFQLQCTWKNSGNDDPSDFKSLRQRAETFAEPFKSANLWVPEGTEILSNFLSFWQPVPWDNKGGRITLCGDAAHPMTFRKLNVIYTHGNCRWYIPERGQGMNHGIADAVVFTKELTAVANKQKSLANAVSAYQEEMISRAGEEVALSAGNTEMLHDWTRFKDSPLMVRGGNPNAPKK
jgi:2-polyprenyl-6-methoxyphenol hydroxylase-like FAD-dependent oxidoreductase